MQGQNVPLLSPRVFCMSNEAFRKFALIGLLAAAIVRVAVVSSYAGEGSAILANPVISATVTVECARPEGRRTLVSRGSGTLIAGVSQAFDGGCYKRTPVSKAAGVLYSVGQFDRDAGDSRHSYLPACAGHSTASRGEQYKRTPEGEMACRFGCLRNAARQWRRGDSQRFDGVCRRTLQPDSGHQFRWEDLCREFARVAA